MFTYDFLKKLWSHYFGFLVTSALAFEARVDPLLECHGFLRFTSSVTPTDLLSARMYKHWWSFSLESSMLLPHSVRRDSCTTD